jgi:hypothetical protein
VVEAEPVVELTAQFVERLQAALDEEGVAGAADKLENLQPHEAIERVIAMRAEARREKDWAASDRLRDALQRCASRTARYERGDELDDVLSSSKGRRGPRQRGRRTELDFDDLVYGIHAVEEALLAGERLRSIAVAADRTKDGALRILLARAKERNVPVRFEQRAFFERVPFKAHQGSNRDRAAVSVRFAGRRPRANAGPTARRACWSCSTI